MYKGAETGSPPFFPLKLLEGVNEGEMTGAGSLDRDVAGMTWWTDGGSPGNVLVGDVTTGGITGSAV